MLFGEIINGEMRSNRCGDIVSEEWSKTALIREEIVIDEFVVMPNHFHGILMILKDKDVSVNVGATWQVAPTDTRLATTTRPNGPKAGSLGAIIGQFKRITTIRINELQGTTGEKIWQRDFYDHIIRNETELNSKRVYVLNNPIKWAEDSENPHYSHTQDKGNNPV